MTPYDQLRKKGFNTWYDIYKGASGGGGAVLILSTEIKKNLASNDLDKVIHTFIPSFSDYYNLHYSYLSQKALSHLKLSLNAAARSLTDAKWRVYHPQF